MYFEREFVSYINGVCFFLDLPELLKFNFLSIKHDYFDNCYVSLSVNSFLLEDSIGIMHVSTKLSCYSITVTFVSMSIAPGKGKVLWVRPLLGSNYCGSLAQMRI